MSSNSDSHVYIEKDELDKIIDEQEKVLQSLKNIRNTHLMSTNSSTNIKGNKYSRPSVRERLKNMNCELTNDTPHKIPDSLEWMNHDLKHSDLNIRNNYPSLFGTKQTKYDSEKDFGKNT